MQLKDPSLSRTLFELESGVKHAPKATLDHLLNLESETFPHAIVAKMRLLRVRLLIYFEQFEEARTHLLETRRMINSQTDTELSAYFQLLLSRLKHHACDPSGALELLDQPISALQEEPMERTTAEFLLESLVCAVHATIDVTQYAKSLEYLELAAELVQRFNVDPDEVLEAVARLHLHLNLHVKAKRIAAFAIERNPMERTFTYAHLLFARACQLSGQTQECLDICSGGFIEVSRRSLESKLRLTVGESFFKMNELSVAKGYVKESLDHAATLVSERDLVKAKLLESSIHKAEGALEAALGCIEEAMGSPAASNIHHIHHKLLAERSWLLARLERHQESAKSYDDLYELRYEARQLEEHGRMQEHPIDALLAMLGMPAGDPNTSTTSGLSLIQANELLTKLAGILDEGRREGRHVSSVELDRLEAELQRYITAPAASVNSDLLAADKHFRSALLSISPSLTSTELKICALIRDDHSSVQIAYKMDVSVRTVDAHRRNIRKKLGLDASSNLRSFLLKF